MTGEYIDLSELLPTMSGTVQHARTQNALNLESADRGPFAGGRRRCCLWQEQACP